MNTSRKRRRRDADIRSVAAAAARRSVTIGGGGVSKMSAAAAHSSSMHEAQCGRWNKRNWTETILDAVTPVHLGLMLIRTHIVVRLRVEHWSSWMPQLIAAEHTVMQPDGKTTSTCPHLVGGFSDIVLTRKPAVCCTTAWTFDVCMHTNSCSVDNDRQLCGDDRSTLWYSAQRRRIMTLNLVASLDRFHR